MGENTIKMKIRDKNNLMNYFHSSNDLMFAQNSCLLSQ